MQPWQTDNRSFFEKLQNTGGPDLPDNLGKRHDYPVVLLAAAIAVLSNRDDCLCKNFDIIANSLIVQTMPDRSRTSYYENNFDDLIMTLKLLNFL